MTERLKLEIQTITIVHIVAIILSLIFFMIFFIRANKDHALKSYLMMQICMIGWMVFKVFKTVSPTVELRWGFIVAYYFCACLLEVAFLEFGYAYYKGKTMRLKARILIYAIASVQFIVVLTNPIHHLFYAKYDFWHDSFGVLFYAHMAIEYIFIGIGFAYCYKVFKVRLADRNIWYKYFISSAIVVPLILNFLYITKIIHKLVDAMNLPVVFDITPIVFTWSIVVFAYATFNSDFLRLNPILEHEIVHKLDTPVCVLDSRYQVIYVNERLNELFMGEGKKTVEKILLKHDLMALNKDEVYYENYYLNLDINEVISHGATQFILIINDITSYKKSEFELSIKQKELDDSNEALRKSIETLKETSKISARNFVAIELHDIIGHSLVVTIKLLEVVKLYYKKDDEICASSLSDAARSISTGISDMNALKSINSKGNIYTGERLKTNLNKMLEKMKHIDLEVKLHFKGNLYQIEEKTFDIINKICKELVTNSLKHGLPKEIFISVNITNQAINILVIDNGKGCERVIKGNGLKGIEERLKLVDGTVEFTSSGTEGFMSKIYIKNGLGK